jgi:DNA-binding NtrC family response regulator
MLNQPSELIFVVDDDPSLGMLLEHWLTGAGYDVDLFTDGPSCLSALHEEIPGAVCLDLGLPGMSGMDVLSHIREKNTILPVIVLTADYTVETVVRAMKLGAYDYLTKPIDRNHLLTNLRNAVEHHRLVARVAQLEREAEGRGYPGIVGSSEAMKEVYRQLDRLALSDVSVLIHGESGTGKELVARALHEASSRRKRPFVAVNCGAIPENLMESEFFGHEKGAFTGAASMRIGRVEEADGGTIFLDEIGELPLDLQVKLLRVLQERTFQKVGSSTIQSSDFRLVSASNRNLAEQVEAGRFREDLYFRLAVFELELPPLRRRREDIPSLAQSMIAQERKSSDTKVQGVSPAALSILMSWDWPGNVRELRNVIQRAIVMANGPEIQPSDLPKKMSHMPNSQNPVAKDVIQADGSTLEDVSRSLLIASLKKHGGNASAVIRELRIGRPRFYRMLRNFKLEGMIEELRQSGKSEE